MIKEAIILAGGSGTRLRSVVSDVPKCMAPVNGKPFLSYIIDSLLKQGVSKFIFSVGYKSEVIASFLKAQYPELDYKLAKEDSPRGTGGGIALACMHASTDILLILNGDTFFDVNVDGLYSFAQQHQSECTLCLKPMNNFDRYGVVEIDHSGRIISFKEKKQYKEGLINGGVYLLDRRILLSLELPEIFSFEKDFLEQYYTSEDMYGFTSESYFIDIGIPEDYEKAQHDFAMK